MIFLVSLIYQPVRRKETPNSISLVDKNIHQLQRLYFVESLQKTLVHKNTYTKNKFSMGVY